jgi:hypothetical protein
MTARVRTNTSFKIPAYLLAALAVGFLAWMAMVPGVSYSPNKADDSMVWLGDCPCTANHGSYMAI